MTTEPFEQLWRTFCQQVIHADPDKGDAVQSPMATWMLRDVFFAGAVAMMAMMEDPDEAQSLAAFNEVEDFHVGTNRHRGHTAT